VSGECNAASVSDPFRWLETATGSYVIERYEHKNPDGVQWLVERVTEDGNLELLRACKTRREAAEYIGALRG